MAANTREASTPFAPDELARNADLFYEADRLEKDAYDIIGTSLATADAWLRFTEAKRVADTKRTEAYQDLMRIRRSTLGSRSSQALCNDR